MLKNIKVVKILQGYKNLQPANFAGCEILQPANFRRLKIFTTCEFWQVAKFRNTAPLHLLLIAF